MAESITINSSSVVRSVYAPGRSVLDMGERMLGVADNALSREANLSANGIPPIDIMIIHDVYDTTRSELSTTKRAQPPPGRCLSFVASHILC